MRIERTHDTEDRLDQALIALRDAKRAAAEAKSQIALAQAEVIRLLNNKQLKSWGVNDGGKSYKATVVAPERVAVDAVGLREKLGPAKFRTIADQVLNETKLEQAIEKGKILAEVVAPFLTTKDSKPYIRFTEGATDDADEATRASDDE